MPLGQLEAARTLGFTERQVLRLVRGPQAFRLALAPMTNDFVALLKDSSLVSVLTVIELTKQTQIFATNLGSWVIPGTLCARDVSRDVAAARRGGAPSRAAMEGADAMSTAILDVRGVHLRRGDRRILSGATFTVARGGIVALMGPSGSGKTTILRAIAGLERFDEGTIVIEGVTLDGGARPVRCRARKLRRQVGLVFQFHHLFEHLSGVAEHHAGAGARAGSPAAAAEDARRNCCARWVSSIARPRFRASCPAAKRSASPSPARSPSTRRC